MVLDVDKKYLKERQYKSSGNLEARIAIHQKFRTNPESFHKWIWNNLKIDKPIKVLEVGCGTGQFWVENYSSLPENSHLTLTDFSEGMIEKISSKLEHSNIKFEVADIENLQYEDNTFDLVMAHHVIYHASDKDKAISELKRVTKPGGTISITSNSEKHMLNVYTISNSIDNNYSMVRNIDGFTEEDADKILPSHFQTYQKEIYEDLLKVTDSDFMLEYIKSTTEPRKMDLKESFYDEWAKIVKDEVDEKGFFGILKRSPNFICKKN